MYFATLPPEELLPELRKRWDNYHNWLSTSGYASRIQASYRQYYALGVKGGMGIEKSQDGSISYVNINHHRNLLTNQKQLITSNKLSFFAKARVSDSDALAASVLGKSVIDYYSEELKLSKTLAKLVETALVCQEAYVSVTWNPSMGKAIAVQNGKPIHAGDIEINLYTPFDIARPTASSKQPWIITRQKESRWDLIAEFPEYAGYIERYGEKPDNKEALTYSLNFDNTNSNQSDDDQVYTYLFYHEASAAVPGGLVVKYVGDQILSHDPIEEIYEGKPVFRLSAGDIINSVAAHGTSIDLIPIQEVLSNLFTSVCTNNINLSMVNLYSEDANTKRTQVSSGMNLWTGTKPPVALALANSSPETYSLINMLIGQSTMIAGGNDVTRGTISNTKLTSGNALALLLSQAINFVSDIQRDYTDLAGDVASQIIRNIRLNAKTELVVALSGKTNRTYSKSFQAQDLQGIDKIAVEIQNPVMATQAGRTQVAESLMGAQMLDTAQDYVAVLTTGDLPSATDGALSLKQGIAEENERLKDGEQVPVLISDRHDIHFQSHIAQLNDPETRKRPDLVESILSHAQEHIHLWQQMDPAMLALLGMQPAPPPPAPPAQQTTPQGMPSEESNLPQLPNLPPAAPEQMQAGYDQAQQDLPNNLQGTNQ